MRKFLQHICLRLLAVVAVGLCYVFAAQALPLDTYRASSRLASGRWVKVKIQNEGMQFVSDEALKSMGFTDPAAVHVYGYGGRRLPQTLDAGYVDDLPLQLSVRTGSGLVFYGVGTVDWQLSGSRVVHMQNPYSTGSYYFLSDAPLGEDDAMPAELYTPYGDDDERVDTAVQYLLHEVETSAGGNTGSDLWGEDFRTTTSRTFTFDLPGAADDNVSFYAAFGAKSSSGSTVTYSVDGKEIGQGQISGTSSSDTHIINRCSRLEGKQTERGKASLTVQFAGGGTVYKALLDFIECSYTRELRLGDAPMVLFYQGAEGRHEVLRVKGVKEGTLVWDVTDPARPRPVRYDRDGSTALFAPAGVGLRRYAVFNPASVQEEPASQGRVSNQDIHAAEMPNLLIISPQEYKSQAERIAEMHRTVDGMAVSVLTPEEIYNEFSCGAPDVTAYRKLMKMWYDRSASVPDDKKFAHCLLFGRATYDQRKLSENLRNSPYPRVLTWQSTMDQSSGGGSLTETNSYVSDNYIAMLEDNDNFSMSRGKLSVGVGRMPVKSLSEARQMTDKLISFVTEPDYGGWRNNVLLLADDGDNAIHAEQMQKLYQYMLISGGEDFLYERMYIDAYDYGANTSIKCYPGAKSRMLKLLEEGVSLWAYIGHANTTSMTGDDMWSYTDLTSMTNKHWPVLYSASCEFIRFDSDAVSGCETMWLHPRSGIIAAIAANRKVYISNNGLTSNAFGHNYFRRGSDNRPRRLGTVYMDAINEVGTDDNKHRYALMGDPAMRVPAPTYQVSVDTMAGKELDSLTDSEQYPVVNGLSKVQVSGRVLNPDGTPATDFNGTVHATLYDAEVVVTTKGHITDPQHPDGKEISYNDRKNKLFSGNFPVTNGQWEATLLLPEEIENNYTQGRLTVHATAESETPLDGAGSTDRFFVYGWDETAPDDSVDPEILYMYLNNSAFRSGATVASNPVFKAKVRDDSGINISSSGVGRLLTVTVDDTKVYDNLADYYVTDPKDPCGGTIAYTLTDLTEGEHTLDFLVWDNAGNSTRSSFKFKIAPQSEIPDLDIYADASPAISSVTFYISSTDAVQGLVEVFDLSGRRVWYCDAQQSDGALSTKWNLNDTGGSRVPRGIYLYRATVRDASGTERKATKKLAVGNP